MSVTPLSEALIKAEQAAAMTVADLREAYAGACHKEPILALLLLDALEDAAKLQMRLQLINTTRGETL